MEQFKVSKKTIHSDKRGSLEEKHIDTIRKIENNNKSVKKLINNLNKLKNDRKNISSSNSEIFDIDKKIKDLENEITKINNNEELTDYLFNAIEFLMDPEDKDEKYTDLNKFIKCKNVNDNGAIYNAYMNKCHGDNSILTSQFKNNFNCKVCEGHIVIDYSQGYTICYDCGNMDRYSYGTVSEWNISETHEFIKPFTYKRTNHFKEWLNQLQGKEGTTISTEVFNIISRELQKQRITDKKDVNFNKIKEILKKLNLTKYYENIPYIINRLTNVKPLVVNPILSEKLIKMFNDIQAPFEKHCPKERKNFLSYSYTLYKFFQLLDEPDYLSYFSLLKSRDKLFEQEVIWKKICDELNWEFIKSI